MNNSKNPGMVILCKRTDDPKLAYIERRLDHNGIPHMRGRPSFHADNTLWVPKQYEAEANRILSEPSPLHLRATFPTLDDIPDDHPLFTGTVNPSGQAGIGWAL